MSISGRLIKLSLAVVLLASTVSVALQGQIAYAAQITNRSLTLQSGPADGGSKPGGVVNHEFKFTVPSVGDTNIGSIRFEYCNEAVGSPVPSSCTTPTGLVTTGGSTALGYENGATGFTLNKTTNGSPYLTKTAASVPANTVLTYRLTNITNPTAVNTSFFVRITTYTGTDGATGLVDSGVVTASTATQIVLTGIMPESLIFCTGATITKTSGIPDCSTASAGNISFNQLFSPSDTATATSQLSASTNALYGYSISVFGPTLTSGGNTVTPMTAGGVGVRGTSQFGMNLKLNTTGTSTVAVGAEVDSAPDGVNLKGQASTGYATVDSFKFVAGGAGNTIAASDNGGSAGPTNAQIYTASYIVNVSGNQVSGTYVSTLTYIATSTF